MYELVSDKMCMHMYGWMKNNQFRIYMKWIKMRLNNVLNFEGKYMLSQLDV